MKDIELEKVSGGTEEITYKYIINWGDYVFDVNHLKSYLSLDTVRTNNPDKVIPVEIRKDGFGIGSTDLRETTMTVSDFMKMYRNYGGRVNGVKI